MERMIKTIIFISVFMGCRFFMKELWDPSWSTFLLELDNNTKMLFKPVVYLFIYGPMIICGYLLFSQAGWLNILGMRIKGAGNYFWASVLCCIPMFVGYAYLSTELTFTLPHFMEGSVYASFFEEVIFRAVLIVALFKYCRLGFIPAALVSAVVFAFGHIYQGNDTASALAAFGITLAAGGWFSWLYCECGYRIWFPMWMHLFMNGAYYVFGMSGGAVGQLEANIFKATTIILSLVYVNMLISKGKKRAITRQNLWKNTPETPATTTVKTLAVA